MRGNRPRRWRRGSSSTNRSWRRCAKSSAASGGAANGAAAVVRTGEPSSPANPRLSPPKTSSPRARATRTPSRTTTLVISTRNPRYNRGMYGKQALARTFWTCAVAVAVVSATGLGAQNQQKPQPPPSGTDPSQVIRTGVELITTDVIVRDNRGQFVADLKKDEFEIYEDGVKQQLVSFTLTHGGRVYNVAAPPPPPPQEGITRPPARPTNDAAGRIFLIFVDDLHLDFRNTGRIRELFKKIAKELIHEGDMFGIVSTGPSSLAIDLTYDRKRLDQAINKITGSGLAPKDIIDVPQGAQGPPEVRYRAHVAFSTANDIIGQLAQVHNRRKAFIYVSNGYDFNPFKESRDKAESERYGRSTDTTQGEGSDGTQQDYDPFRKQGQQFVEADLVSDLSWLTRNANRANVTMYTI